MVSQYLSTLAVRAYLTTPLSAIEMMQLKELRSKCNKFKKGDEKWYVVTVIS